MRVRSAKARGPEFLHPSLLEPLADQALEPSIADELAATFRVLSDATRVRIVHALSVVEEACVYDLALALGIGQSALSHQLALLRGQRVVSRRKEGRIVYYRLASGTIRRALTAGLRDLDR